MTGSSQTIQSFKMLEDKPSKVLSLGGGEMEKAYAYREVLLEQSRQEGLRKGIRTELRIRWAACALLESTSLDALKVQDICLQVEIAQGTLYQYFPDRDSLLEQILQDFVVFMKERMLAAARSSVGYEASVRQSTQTYSRLFEQNCGLMKCLLNHYETFPKAKTILQSLNRDWNATVVESVKKKRLSSGFGGQTSDVELQRRAYALGGMVDQYLSSIFLYADQSLSAIAGDRDAVVETLTYIWLQSFKDQFEPPK